MKTAFLSQFKRSLATPASVAWFLALLAGFSAWAESFVPADDAQVLERVRVSPKGAAPTDLRKLRARLDRDSGNLDTALELAKTCIAHARSESEPRYLGYAAAALDPWTNRPDSPPSVLLLRATIRQSNHDFDGALVDLESVLRADPKNAQAWLTRATVFQVQGRYDEAKRACFPLMRLASELVSVTCASGLASLNGNAVKSYELLALVLDRSAAASEEEKLWATTCLAEMATRLGRRPEAERHFRAALSLDPNNAYTLGAFADFLLDEGRPTEVTDLLRRKTRIDSLLLRFALAEKIENRAADAEKHITALRERFSAIHERGDNVHQREEARFTLHLLQEPREALRLALSNWHVQREPADVRILLETAIAAANWEVAERVAKWLRETRLEDVHLNELLTKLEAKRKSAT